MVDGKYALRGNRITFEIAGYDKTKPLVIDPVLSYSTYLGGSGGDVAFGIAVDSKSGDAFITGQRSRRRRPGGAEPVQHGELKEAEAFTAVQVDPPHPPGHPANRQTQVTGKISRLIGGHIAKLA